MARTEIEKLWRDGKRKTEVSRTSGPRLQNGLVTKCLPSSAVQETSFQLRRFKELTKNVLISGGNNICISFYVSSFFNLRRLVSQTPIFFLHFALNDLDYKLLILMIDRLSLVQSSSSSSITQETPLLETRGKLLKNNNLSTLKLIRFLNRSYLSFLCFYNLARTFLQFSKEPKGLRSSLFFFFYC